MLGWLTSPVLKYAAIALAVVSALSWIRSDAAHDATLKAEAKCRSVTAAALLTEQNRQAKIRVEVLKDAQERAALAEREAAELKEAADALVKEVAGTSRSCRLDDDILRKLRRIR